MIWPDRRREGIRAAFRTESAAAAILQHPNIVAIHDVGVHDGRHYFSMDYVEGQSLAQRVGQQPLSPAKAARYVEFIAEAIHYAHERGILHRDLKPSNVLIESKLTSRALPTGLARRLDDSSLDRQVLGSPTSCPNKPAGRGGLVVPVTCTLGGILYYLLTARRLPGGFVGALSRRCSMRSRSRRLVESFDPKGPGNDHLKCWRRPSRRYQTAQERPMNLRFLRREPSTPPNHGTPETLALGPTQAGFGRSLFSCTSSGLRG
jgi:serine/threonine-protein kinase